MTRRSPSERRTGGAAALVCAALLAGCSDDADRAAPEQNVREEFSWRERLAIAPAGAPLPREDLEPLPESAGEALRALDGRPLVAAKDALDVLRAAGPAVLAPLARLATAEDPAIRAAAVTALGESDDPAAAPALANALRDPDPNVALIAALALGRLRQPWTMPLLLQTMGPIDGSPRLDVRVLCAAALVGMGCLAPVPMLLKVVKEGTALEDPDREWEASSRVAFEKEEAWRALRGLLGADLACSPDAPAAAQEAVIRRAEERWADRAPGLFAGQPDLEDPLLRSMVDRLVEGLAIYQVRVVDNARAVLIGLGPGVVPWLLPHLDDPRSYVRAHVLEVLLELAPWRAGGDALFGAVAPLFAAPDPALRALALQVGGASGASAAAPRIRPALDDPDPSVRAAAARALASLDDLATLAPRAAGATRDEVWAIANLALGRSGDAAAASRLFAALASDDLREQAAALGVLGDAGLDTAAFPLGGPAEARRPAAEALRAAWSARFPPPGLESSDH